MRLRCASIVVGVDWATRVRCLLVVLAIGLGAVQPVSAAGRSTSAHTSPAICPTAGQGRDVCALYDLRSGTPVRRDDFDDAFYARTDVVIIGEVHDNPQHHRLQARVIDRMALAAQPGRLGLVLEHVRAGQTKALADALAGIDRGKPEFWVQGAEDVRSALVWDRGGWPAWSMFLPIFETALRRGVVLVPGDAGRPQLMAIARGGLAKLDADARRSLGLDEALDDGLADALLADLEQGHCGLMPRSSLGKMVDAQRYRDAHIAAAVLRAQADYGRVVLLTGNGHARLDRGVPWYVRRKAGTVQIAAVLIVEAERPLAARPAAVVPRSPDGRFAADYAILTPPQTRPDPCEALRKRFRKSR